MNINQKLKKLGEHLETGLVGRRDHARMLLLAAVAGENAILFGPPGTAKSLLARRLKDCFADDVKYFECLLTKFSMPEEVFGPVSLKGLEQDIFRRVYDRYMPGAGIAFIDETFKANSAILNSMLTILNEREFDTGNERIKVPLRCVVGASNEMPKESELEALYDRFIIRMRVDRLKHEDELVNFLTNKAEYQKPPIDIRLSKDELSQISQASAILPVDEPVIRLFLDLREWCQGKGIKLSDRRLLKIRELLKAAAYTSNRQSVSLSETWVIRYCAWDDFGSRQFEELVEWLDSHIDKQQQDLSGLSGRVDAEQSSYEKKAKTHKRNEKGKLIFVDKNGDETTKPGVEGYEYNSKDDNNGKLYTEVQIKDKLKTDNQYSASEIFNRNYCECIAINGKWVGLEAHFIDIYSKNLKKFTHKPKMENGVYTSEQRERFKTSVYDLINTLKSKCSEISSQIQKITLSLDSSPWTPKEYQESHLAGLRINLQEIEKHQHTLENLIIGYDKLLVTSDTEKLTDPSA
jgi:MoxR-like ATPase